MVKPGLYSMLRDGFTSEIADLGMIGLAEVDELDEQIAENHDVCWLQVEMDYLKITDVSEALDYREE